MDFLSDYLQYTSNTEAPATFHRWAAITGVGAVLRKTVWMEFGSTKLYPNLYTMLVGDPGSRKSTAIKQMKQLLLASGYTTIAADKTTKEKFLIDLQEQQLGADPMKSEEAFVHFLETSLDELEPACMLIAADEFNDFTGNGNIEFYSTLGVLWDAVGTYKSRVKHGKSVSVHEPSISILAGNTSAGISLAFPPEVLGQGFISRLLLVYGENSGRRITFPPVPEKEKTDDLVKQLKEIQTLKGCITFSEESIETVDKIYQHWTDLPDVRFRSYSTRRLTQLFKVSTILCAARFSRTVRVQEVVEANTYLAAIESRMPNALGEYGKSKHSDISQKILKILTNASGPVPVKVLWKEVHNDLDQLRDLATLLQNLKEADKIQYTEAGFLPKVKTLASESAAKNSHLAFVDWKLLTKEEQSFYRVL